MANHLRRFAALLLSTAPIALASALQGQAATAHMAEPAKPLTWVTLGTAGGPSAQRERSQPANLLIVDGKPMLIDVGDGAVERLVGAGFESGQVDTVFLSHLHVDHTAGLFGLIALRWFTRGPGTLTVYGPPGTNELVDGIVAGLQPAQGIGIGVEGPGWNTPIRGSVRVVILQPGKTIMIAGVQVATVENTHYADAQGRIIANGSTSLSYRFDKNGYGIGYTGDTGPSEPMTDLFRGVDLLVTELIDLPAIKAEIVHRFPAMPEPVRQALFRHFQEHHLSPDQIAAIGTRTGAKRVVLTHLTAAGPTVGFASRLTAEVRRTFIGVVNVAHDLDRF